MFCSATLQHNGVGALNEAAVRAQPLRCRTPRRTHTPGAGAPNSHLGSASGELSRAHVCDTRHRHGKGFTALLSVSSPAAFWGESDDSSSELEAALRPQAHSADSDDFGDFYD